MADTTGQHRITQAAVPTALPRMRRNNGRIPNEHQARKQKPNAERCRPTSDNARKQNSPPPSTPPTHHPLTLFRIRGNFLESANDDDGNDPRATVPGIRYVKKIKIKKIRRKRGYSENREQNTDEKGMRRGRSR